MVVAVEVQWSLSGHSFVKKKKSLVGRSVSRTEFGGRDGPQVSKV